MPSSNNIFADIQQIFTSITKIYQVSLNLGKNWHFLPDFTTPTCPYCVIFVLFLVILVKTNFSSKNEHTRMPSSNNIFVNIRQVFTSITKYHQILSNLGEKSRFYRILWHVRVIFVVFLVIFRDTREKISNISCLFYTSNTHPRNDNTPILDVLPFLKNI